MVCFPAGFTGAAIIYIKLTSDCSPSGCLLQTRYFFCDFSQLLVKWVVWLFHLRWPPGKIILEDVFWTSFIARLVDLRIDVPFSTELFDTTSYLGVCFSVPDDIFSAPSLCISRSSIRTFLCSSLEAPAKVHEVIEPHCTNEGLWRVITELVCKSELLHFIFIETKSFA